MTPARTTSDPRRPVQAHRPATYGGPPPVSERSRLALAGFGIVVASSLGAAGTVSVPVEGHIAYLAAGYRGSSARGTDGPGADEVGAPAEWNLDLRSSVRWLHNTTGLTWDQLARAFGVSRRAVHLWATGGRLNSTNAEHVNELIGIVRRVQATNPTDVRAALLAPRPEGRSLFDDFRIRTQATPGDVAGTPFSPSQLLGARHDPVEGDY